MKYQPRYNEFVALKMTTALRRRLEAAARSEDRSTSSFLRRLVERALGEGK